jgi:hypothetical protein
MSARAFDQDCYGAPPKKAKMDCRTGHADSGEPNSYPLVAGFLYLVREPQILVVNTAYFLGSFLIG